jgi:hypothetical protein
VRKEPKTFEVRVISLSKLNLTPDSDEKLSNLCMLKRIPFGILVSYLEQDIGNFLVGIITRLEFSYMLDQFWFTFQHRFPTSNFTSTL